MLLCYIYKETTHCIWTCLISPKTKVGPLRGNHDVCREKSAPLGLQSGSTTLVTTKKTSRHCFSDLVDFDQVTREENMPFLAKEHHPVPTNDILSWVCLAGPGSEERSCVLCLC